MPVLSETTQGRRDDVFGRRRVHMLSFQFDSSYPTGGEDLGLAALGVRNVAQAKVFVTQRAPLTGAYAFVWDRDNGKLLAFVEEAVAAGGPLVEVANATDLSAVIVDILVIEP